MIKPIQTIGIATCDKCDSAHVTTGHTDATEREQGNGSVRWALRRMKCLECGATFKVIADARHPKSGQSHASRAFNK